MFENKDFDYIQKQNLQNEYFSYVQGKNKETQIKLY